MKKIISSVMAMAMVASMSTMSFAAEQTSIMVDEYSKLYKETDGILTEVTGDLTARPGEKFYVEIASEDGSDITSKIAGQYKVVTDWKNGSEVFEKAAIENKKVAEKTEKYVLAKGKEAPYGLEESYSTLDLLKEAVDKSRVHLESCETPDCTEPTHVLELSEEQKAEAISRYNQVYTNDYRYFAAVYTKSSFSTKGVDLIGSVKVIKKNSSSSTKASTKEINAFVGYDVAEVTGNSHDVENNQPVLDFSAVDGEIDINFGDVATFTVNATNQGKLHMGYTTKPNTDLIDQNPNANIDFITFSTKPTFNRIGTMRIYGDEGLFVYEMTNSGLKAVKTQYDEDYDAYAFNTRTLTSYVISDKELKFSNVDNVVEDGVDNVPDEITPDVKPNPETGASNGMAVASALLLISMSGAAVMLAKKVR